MFAAFGGLAARFSARACALPSALFQHTRRALTTRKETILKMAKGYRGRSKNCWRLARQRVEKALQYSYISRRLKKRDARKGWIMQINAGAREYNMRYSELINGLSLAKIGLNRKVLSQLAIQEPYSFRAVISEAKVALERKAANAAASKPPIAQ